MYKYCKCNNKKPPMEKVNVILKAPLNVKASEINACKQVNVHY